MTSLQTDSIWLKVAGLVKDVFSAIACTFSEGYGSLRHCNGLCRPFVLLR